MELCRDHSGVEGESHIIETENLEERSRNSKSDKKSNILNKAIVRAIYSARHEKIREVCRASDGGLKSAQIVQDNCVVMKM